MTDPIADMLSRIRNAILAKHKEVVVPHSILKNHIANVLKEEGYLNNVDIIEKGIKKDIKIKIV